MKNIKTLALLAVGGLAVCGFAIAQVHNGDAWDHGAMQHHADPASVVKHLAAAFPKFAPFDVNKDGKLDATEKESIAKAIADGTLEIPAHTPPNGVKPSAEMMLNHIADVYAFLASKDVNHDGALDEAEQAAIKSAIERGELAGLHGKYQHDAGEDHH